MSDNHVKNIVLVGASGNVGASILQHLLAKKTFNITVITRSDSTSILPTDPSITVRKGDYSDAAFLHAAFSNQDVAIFALSFTATNAHELIDAAASAGVKWILPTEYSADGANETMMNAVPLFQPKIAARKHIQALAAQGGAFDGVKWIGVVTNPWMEFSLQRGMFGIDIAKRQASLLADGGVFNTSTLAQVGYGVAQLLSLPVENAGNARESLARYANGFVYISSFLVTQQQLLDSVLAATGTTEADWDVDRSKTSGEKIEWAQGEMAKGDFMAGAVLLYTNYMGEGLGGDYEDKAKIDRAVLGLPREDLDAVVKSVVASSAA